MLFISPMGVVPFLCWEMHATGRWFVGLKVLRPFWKDLPLSLWSGPTGKLRNLQSSVVPLINGFNPAEHIVLGRSIAGLKDEKILVLG